MDEAVNCLTISVAEIEFACEAPCPIARDARFTGMRVTLVSVYSDSGNASLNVV
jgi:hypothetical protein